MLDSDRTGYSSLHSSAFTDLTASAASRGGRRPRDPVDSRRGPCAPIRPWAPLNVRISVKASTTACLGEGGSTEWTTNRPHPRIHRPQARVARRETIEGIKLTNQRRAIVEPLSEQSVRAESEQPSGTNATNERSLTAIGSPPNEERYCRSRELAAVTKRREQSNSLLAKAVSQATIMRIDLVPRTLPGCESLMNQGNGESLKHSLLASEGEHLKNLSTLTHAMTSQNSRDVTVVQNNSVWSSVDTGSHRRMGGQPFKPDPSRLIRSSFSINSLQQEPLFVSGDITCHSETPVLVRRTLPRGDTLPQADRSAASRTLADIPQPSLPARVAELSHSHSLMTSLSDDVTRWLPTYITPSSLDSLRIPRTKAPFVHYLNAPLPPPHASLQPPHASLPAHRVSMFDLHAAMRLTPAGTLLHAGGPAVGNKRVFGCAQCRYVTDRKNNLKRHVATMHQRCDKSLECCGVAFSSKASLRDHVAIFHGAGYMCRYCARNFCRKALLKRHLTVHSGVKEYACGECDYATSHKSNLERHRRVHERQTYGASPSGERTRSSDPEDIGDGEIYRVERSRRQEEDFDMINFDRRVTNRQQDLNEKERQNVVAIGSREDLELPQSSSTQILPRIVTYQAGFSPGSIRHVHRSQDTRNVADNFDVIVDVDGDNTYRVDSRLTSSMSSDPCGPSPRVEMNRNFDDCLRDRLHSRPILESAVNNCRAGFGNDIARHGACFTDDGKSVRTDSSLLVLLKNPIADVHFSDVSNSVTRVPITDQRSELSEKQTAVGRFNSAAGSRWTESEHIPPSRYDAELSDCSLSADDDDDNATGHSSSESCVESQDEEEGEVDVVHTDDASSGEIIDVVDLVN